MSALHRIAASMLLTLVVGCGPTYRMDAPSSFKRYERSSDFRWITPEGVVLRAREVANEPVATLAFWAEATRHHLERTGYKLHKQSSFRTQSGLAGERLDFMVPRGGEDWQFTVGLLLHGDRLIILEAGGPWAQVHALDAELDGALRSFDPGP